LQIGLPVSYASQADRSLPSSSEEYVLSTLIMNYTHSYLKICQYFIYILF
jgi:hypothetical protein